MTRPEKIPLIVAASDLDQLSQLSTCAVLRCSSETLLDIVDSPIYRWRLLSGAGTLLNTEGPATLYEPPELSVSGSDSADVVVEILDLSAEDTAANGTTSVAFRINVSRVSESLYAQTVTVQAQSYSGVRGVGTGESPCCRVTNYWLPTPHPIEVNAPLVLSSCVGERVVLAAFADDMDTLQTIFDCSNPLAPGNHRTAYADDMHFRWFADRGSFPDYVGAALSNGRKTAVIYQAPDQPGEDRVTCRISDAGVQGADTAIEKSITMRVFGLSIRMNATATPLDNVVMVTAPTSPARPFTALSLELSGPPNFSARVMLRQAGVGEVSFDDPAPTLAVGQPRVVRVFGERRSQTENDTAILVTVNGAVCARENLTVVEGIKIRLAGTFFFACENNNGSRINRACGQDPSPLVWQATPLPCEGIGRFFRNLYFQEGQMRDTSGVVIERFSLESGKRRAVEVIITGVKTFGPEVDLDGRDPFLTSGLAVRGIPNSAPNGGARVGVILTDDCDKNPATGNGRGQEDGAEVLLSFGVRFDDTFGLAYVNSASSARIWTKLPGGPPTFAHWLNDMRDVGNLSFPAGESGCVSSNMTYVASDGSLQCMQPQALKELLIRNAGFRSWERQAWANWTSRNLQVVPGTNASRSFIARLFNDAIVGHPRNANGSLTDRVHAEGFLQLARYDWYTLVGEVTKGVVSTPDGIDVRFEEHLESAGCPSPREIDEGFSNDPY